ncbi:MAG: magnesium transporter [Chloroflexi bacterium]|jgi:magnesium transporter|nr:magnesium transporter [Chloroflexota bacterium]
MEANILNTTLLLVRDLLQRDDVAGALRIIESLRPPDQADIFEELPPEQQMELIPQLEAEAVASILEELEDEDAAELASGIDASVLAQIVDEMGPDEAADLLGDLDPTLSVATLSQMQEADEVRPLLLHPDQTAGGLMTSEYLAFPQCMRIDKVLPVLREWDPKGGDLFYLYVVDTENRLVGVASLLQIIRAKPDEQLSSIMKRETIKAHVTDDQEAAARLMARYDLTVVPVVDDEEHLVGVITVDDLVEVLEDEATEDIQRYGGTVPLDRAYLDTSVAQAAWKRLGWLLLLFVTGTLTSTVMSMFEAQLTQVIALAMFVPLLIGTGGNAGAQTTATIIRALSVGDIELRDAIRVIWHELRTALILAAMLAAVAFVRAFFWEDSAPLALAVSLSILAIVIWADLVGAVLPLLAVRLRIDPAVVSGPLMSTLVDATGLLIYFSIASLILGL